MKVISKLKGFSYKAKKLFFENFEKHRSLKRLQPLGFGNDSVGATMVDMKELLQVVKTARQKDHLAIK
jgi:hypothetical protein